MVYFVPTLPAPGGAGQLVRGCGAGPVTLHRLTSPFTTTCPPMNQDTFGPLTKMPRATCMLETVIISSHRFSVISAFFGTYWIATPLSMIVNSWPASDRSTLTPYGAGRLPQFQHPNGPLIKCWRCGNDYVFPHPFLHLDLIC